MTFAALLKWLLVLLALANLAVLAAWLGPPLLRAWGVLPPPVPQQRELIRLALPAPPASGAATPVPDAADGEHAPAEPARAAGAPVARGAAPTRREPNALRCAVVGPFPDQAAAQAARARIAAVGGSAQLQAEENEDTVVLLPPAATSAAAERTRQALRRHQIDAYVMPSGQYRNGISVGIFRNRALALAQQRRVAELGYAAQLIGRKRLAYRLLAMAPAAALAELPHEDCEPPAPAG